MASRDTKPEILGSVQEGIATLFGAERDAFGAAYNRSEPFVHRAPPERLGELAGICGDGDVQAFLRRHVGMRVYVQLPGGTEGELTEPIWDRFVQGGNHVKAHPDDVPVVRAWHDALCRDLGPVETIAGRDATLVISDAGTGVPWHHDEELELVIVQLRGAKRWWYAPARDELSTTRLGLTVPHTGQAMSDPAARRAVDERLTSSATSIDVQAGDVLYLPPYHWHRTEALATPSGRSSWSMTFAVPRAKPIDVARRALQAALNALEVEDDDVLGRELSLDADGALTERPLRSSAERVQALITAAAREAIVRLTAEDGPETLPFEWDPRLLRRPAGVSFELLPGPSFWWLIVTGPDMREEIPIAASLLHLTRWLATSGGSFSFLRACAEAPNLTRRSLVPLFDRLLGCGALVRVSAE